MYLTQNIKFLRKQKKMAQKELADLFGVKQQSVANWEVDLRRPDIETVVRLAEYFDVTLDDLVLRELKPQLPAYATNIEFLRKKNDMSQEDMGNLLGVTKKWINECEKGEREADIGRLIKVSDFFGVTLDQLVKHNLEKEDM